MLKKYWLEYHVTCEINDGIIFSMYFLRPCWRFFQLFSFDDIYRWHELTIAMREWSMSQNFSFYLNIFCFELTELQDEVELETFPMSDFTPSRLLYEAAGADNLNAMLHALACGAEPNYRCEEDRLRTSLHKVTNIWIIHSHLFR